MGGPLYEVTIKQSFSAAHMLNEIGGRCEKLHGHNFVVEISICSNVLSVEGILIDFRILKQWADEILKDFDHKYLNDISYFKDTSPSSENVAKYIYDRISEKVKESSLDVSRVTVWESEDARASYYGNNHDRHSKSKR
jgi:6-pyruvoyltetrahydropterin/6-carboxytetrahydropterin synthase